MIETLIKDTDSLLKDKAFLTIDEVAELLNHLRNVTIINTNVLCLKEWHLFLVVRNLTIFNFAQSSASEAVQPYYLSTF